MDLLPRFKTLNKPAGRLPASSGVTLMEMALAMMIVAVVGVGVSGLLKVGAEHNLSERQHQTMQIVALNLVDDLRHDLRTADSINALGSGSNTLTIQGNGQTITYSLNTATHRMSRQVNGSPAKVYNDPNIFLSNMQVQCSPTCFQVATDAQTGQLMVTSTGIPKEIVIPRLTVTVPLANGNAGTMIDQSFGAPNYALNQFAFHVTTSTEFQ